MSKGKKKKSGNGAGAVAFGVTFVLLSSIFKIHGLFSLAVQLAVSAFGQRGHPYHGAGA